MFKTVKKHLTKILILTGFLGVAFTTTSLNLAGEVIDYPIIFDLPQTGIVEVGYTDDNVGEDLIILSDKSHYAGISGNELYFTILSETGDVEADLSFLFNGSENVEWIKQVSVVDEEVYIPVYSDILVECPVGSASTTCSETVQTGTTTEIIKREVLSNIDFVSDTLGADSTKVKKKIHVTVPKITKTKGKIAKAETYANPNILPLYKAYISYPKDSNGEFFIEVNGAGGEYGLLDPWFNSSWTYKKKIEIDSSKVSATLTSYPVFVDLANLGSDLFDNAKSDGCDIRIVESDDTTETAFELVAYATTTATGEIHFMADSVSGTATTTFYLYYGNSGASCYAVTGTYGRNAVWSGFISRYHLNGLTDSTGTNDLTGSGSPTHATGKVGTGIDFERDSSQYAQKTAVSGLPANNADCTVSGWMKIENSVDFLVAVGLHGAKYFGSQIDGTDNYSIYNIGGNEAWEVTANTLLPASGTWVHTAIIREGTATSKLYINGSLKITFSVTGATTVPDVITIGASSGGTADFFDGMMDEVSISSTAFNADWVTTEYNNQSSPSTFYFIGAQETDSVATTPELSGGNWFGR